MEVIMSLFKLYSLLEEWPLYMRIPQRDVFQISLGRKLKNLVLFVVIVLMHNHKR